MVEDKMSQSPCHLADPQKSNMVAVNAPSRSAAALAAPSGLTVASIVLPEGGYQCQSCNVHMSTCFPELTGPPDG